MTPTIRFCTTPECTYSSFGAKNLPYRVEIDGRAVGPVVTEKEAASIAKWLDLSWEELP
jgi:hypothetical protein